MSFDGLIATGKVSTDVGNPIPNNNEYNPLSSTVSETIFLLSSTSLKLGEISSMVGIVFFYL